MILVLEDPTLKAIATRESCSTAQVCIGYALAKGLAVVTKSEKEERMRENLNSINLASKLTNEDVKLIDSLNKNQRLFWDPYLAV